MLSPISLAHAEGPAAPPPGAELINIAMLAGFVLLFYFIIWRPQSKRAKEHKKLIDELAKGDEVLTTGGLIGRVTKIEEGFVVLQVADNIELKFQRQAITASLPKGTMKAI